MAMVVDLVLGLYHVFLEVAFETIEGFVSRRRKAALSLWLGHCHHVSLVRTSFLGVIVKSAIQK
jgi:hypothetical protein